LRKKKSWKTNWIATAITIERIIDGLKSVFVGSSFVNYSQAGVRAANTVKRNDENISTYRNWP
jgi:hypothetical protein